jgi:Exopolysaccharide synthesis, ExoD
MLRLIGLGIVIAGLGLRLPLPIPFSNSIPAWAVVLLAIGMMEKDGLCVLLGHLTAIVPLKLKEPTTALESSRQAPQNDRKCWLALIRRLISRWSCSRTLFRYGTGRCRQSASRAPSAFEPHDRRRVRAVTVGVDDTRHGMVLPTQRFGQEALCCGRVLPGREEKVEGRAGRIHRTIQVAPLALDADVSLVHPPTVIGRFEPRSQSTFHFRGVTLHPAPDGNVVDKKSAFFLA